MKFQDDISNMNTYIRTYIHTDKPKPICPLLFQSWGQYVPYFFKVGGIRTTDLNHFNKFSSSIPWHLHGKNCVQLALNTYMHTYTHKGSFSIK